MKKLRDSAIILGCIYVMVATLRYRLVNPDMSETRLFLNIFEALLWQ